MSLANINGTGETHLMFASVVMILYHCCRVMLFIFALPVMQVILFCLAIGRDPTGLRLAVVNHELNQSGGHCEFSDGCSFKMLSCRYLQNLNNDSIVKVRLSSLRVTVRCVAAPFDMYCDGAFLHDTTDVMEVP